MKAVSVRKSGFTLVELLVVITIIVTLMAILVPVVAAARERAVKLRATNTLSELINGVNLYFNTYNVLPSNSAAAPQDDEEVETTEPIMSVLAGINLDNQNRKETVFYAGEEARGSSRATAYGGLWQEANNAELFDPWKKKAGAVRGYIILLDYGYDEKLDNPFDPGRVLGRRVVAWSSGKDGKWNRGKPKIGDNKDNVYSWF